ncbi:DUF2330 domain-containing protein [Nannocystis sp. SCPEA4]|uniref:DUF2330 domain-containing protein n=1 Tax=Nannocystis sp. SCPEA4 TaxID=2996787 RepID=UPI0022709460|nr:DUF2330 domain-containing protein [Nannocystis sp. SCPEA4]MCY1058870.1 DUF2330 domain-containing protein [Nannocystis sp. SCPEA4]
MQAVLGASLVTAPATAVGFDGLFVGRDGRTTTSRTSSVVLMRERTRTVMTVQGTYEGPREDFALVMPVPASVRREDVRVLPREVMATVASVSAPQMLEFWEQDPCAAGLGPALNGIKTEPQRRRSWAVLEGDGHACDHCRGGWGRAQFVGGEYEYDVVDGSEVMRWLGERGFAGASGAPWQTRRGEPRWLVAVVDVARVPVDADGRMVLSPLRFEFESKRFALPRWPGLHAAGGAQDMALYVLGQERFQVVGRDNVAIPTAIEVAPDRARFSSGYATLLADVRARHPGAAVTEFAARAYRRDAWREGRLDGDKIASLGGDVLWGEHDAPPRQPLGPPVADIDVTAEDAYQATDPQVHAKYAPKQARRRGPIMHAPHVHALVLTRLRILLAPDAGPIELVAAPGVQGGPADRRFSADPLARQSTGPGRPARFLGYYVGRHAWAEPLACQYPRREVWREGPPGAEAQPPTPASTFAAPGAVLTEFLVDRPAEPYVLPGAERPLVAPSTADCGRCEASGEAGLGALLGLLGRRRRRRS